MREKLPYLIQDSNLIIEQDFSEENTIVTRAWPDAAGSSSIAIALVSIALFWLPLMNRGTAWMILLFGTGLASTILGLASSFGILKASEKKPRSVVGFYGMLLGLAALILGSGMYVVGYIFLRG